METQSAFQSLAYEQKVINILRKLPPERFLQLVDFAQYLELKSTKVYDDWLDDEETETDKEIRASGKKWDELLAKPEACYA